MTVELNSLAKLRPVRKYSVNPYNVFSRTYDQLLLELHKRHFHKWNYFSKLKQMPFFEAQKLKVPWGVNAQFYVYGLTEK